MKTTEVIISFPAPIEGHNEKKLLHAIAELLEDSLTNWDFAENQTVAETIGVGDCVPTLHCGGYVIEIDL